MREYAEHTAELFITKQFYITKLNFLIWLFSEKNNTLVVFYIL